MCTSGDNNGEIRRIKGSSGYTASSTTITVNFAFSNRVDSADAFELHRVDPSLKHQAIDAAIEELAYVLYLPIRSQSIFIDDLLSNSDFETFSSGAFTGWTTVGSPTLTAEGPSAGGGGPNFQGSQSAKIASGGGAAGQLTQTPTINCAEAIGKTVSFKRWVYAAAASSARVRIDFGGSVFENSEYHTGVSEWQLLEAKTAIPSSATQVKVICEAPAGKTGFFDGPGGLVIDPIHKYDIPTTITHGPHYVTMQYDEDKPNGPYIPINGRPTSGRILMVEGMGLLNTPTSDTGTTEVTEPRIRLIVAKALEILTSMTSLVSIEDGDIRGNPAFWARRADNLINQPGIRMAPMAAQMPQGWHLEEDSDGRYIILDYARSPALTF